MKSMGVTRIYFYLTCLYLTTVVNSFNTYGADDLAASPIDLGKDVTPICESFAGAFADAAANYTRCFIVNSRPLSLCSNCIVQYLTVKQAYRQLEKMVDSQSFNGKTIDKPCNEWILNSDRIMAIQQTKTFFENLWKTSNCGNCFSSSSYKGNITYSLAKYVTKFSELHNTTAACFKNFTYGYAEVNGTDVTSPTRACTVCHKPYTALSNFYQHLDLKWGSGLCMDIVDSMNYTRIQWGYEFNCTGNARQDGITITITVLFFLLPTVFYIASHIHYQSIEKKIVKQNRMKRRITGQPNGQLYGSRAASQPAAMPSTSQHNHLDL